jgi:hypothetical protein
VTAPTKPRKAVLEFNARSKGVGILAGGDRILRGDNDGDDDDDDRKELEESKA